MLKNQQENKAQTISHSPTSLVSPLTLDRVNSQEGIILDSEARKIFKNARNKEIDQWLKLRRELLQNLDKKV